MLDAKQFSLADFAFGDSSDPLVPPAEFAWWRRETEWESALYEAGLLAAPVPRTQLAMPGGAGPVLNLGSYNYLGLAHHPETVAAAHEALAHYGIGACGSPILSGRTALHLRLEQEVSAFLGREATLLFNSGFAGGFGCMAGLLRKDDVALIDSRCHFSLLDGAAFARARVEVFEHNSVSALDAALGRHRGKRRLIVVEGIYSMDGDMADLPALLPVAEAHGVSVFIDEAHSILACGNRGRGVVEHFGVEERIGLLYGTFSKAFACVGGYACGSKTTIDYLRFYARPYGYSCALPPAMAGALLAGLKVATRDDSLRRRLWENADYFRTQLQAQGIDTGDSTSYVIPIILGADRPLLYELGHAFLRRGLFVTPVDYPSVPIDQVRFRVSITAAHTRADLDEALDIIDRTVPKRVRRMA